MKILLDSCAFIYLAGKEELIPKKTLDLILDAENEILLSSISVWEMILKESIGKSVFRKPAHQVIKEITNLYSISPLPFTQEDAYYLSELAPVHKDPFDRMLICQAMQQNLFVATDDKTFSNYPINTIW